MQSSIFRQANVLLCFCMLLSVNIWSQDAPKRSIEHIKGNVYFFHENIHNSAFMVTADGIILVDPLNKGAGEWLKAELKTRFNQPVKYIIYSHYHGDHASGAEAFADTVVDIYAHENTPDNIRNDKNKDQVKVLPTKTYSGHTEILLGGKKVELVYLDSDAHANDMTVVRFPEERIVFVVDVVSVNRISFRYLGSPTVEEVNDVTGLIKQLDLVAGMDFDILANGHFGLGTLDDIRKNRKYITDLRDRVDAEMKAGKDLAQILETVKMEEYSQLGFYKEFLALNIEGMHYWLSKQVVDQ